MGRSNAGPSYEPKRRLFYCVCALQLASIFERQIFDFLGYMWLPILGNFWATLFTILGIFGAHQRRLGYIVSYLIWDLLWICWNTFVICYYLEIGGMSLSDDYLALGTRSYSWWMANGYGCRPEYFQTSESSEPPPMLENEGFYYPIRPTRVTGCLLDFQYIEVIHAGIQILFAVIGILFSIYFVVYRDTFLFTVLGGSNASSNSSSPNSSTQKQPLYSIEYNTPRVMTSSLSRTEGAATLTNDLYSTTDDNIRNGNGSMTPGHMTPRRVKRRAHHRSSARTFSSRTRKSSLNRSAHSLGSERQIRSTAAPAGQTKGINPLTRLIDTNLPPGPSSPRHPDSSTSNDEMMRQAEQSYGQINPAYESSRPNSLYSVQTANTAGPGVARPVSQLTSYSNFHGQRNNANRAQPQEASHVNLTQESFLQQAHSQSQPQSLQPNLNYHEDDADDLPLPPPPDELKESLTEPHSHAQAQAPPPVPQQRGNSSSSKLRNEYVNMPISSGPIHNEINQNDMQTLRATDRLIVPTRQSYRMANGRADLESPPPPPLPPHNPSGPQKPQPQQHQAPPSQNPASEDDYGFSTRGPLGQLSKAEARLSTAESTVSSSLTNGQLQQHVYQQHVSNGAVPRTPNGYHHQQQQQQQSSSAYHPYVNHHGREPESHTTTDRWYLKDSMRPVGAPAHGGDCKCYRCQRKLTAI